MSSSLPKANVSIYEAFHSKTEECRRRALEYIAKGGCLTEVDNNKMTLLHHAAFGGDEEVVKALVDVVNGTGGQAAAPVVAGACPSTTLSGQRIDLDGGDVDGWTALHYAADRGHTAVVRLLVEEAGANVNVRDHSNRTPLHLAALGARRETVTALLEAGAKKSIKNAAGMTPAECASAAGHDAVAALLTTESRA